MAYYGFEYWGGERTTTGSPNSRTGRMSIAGELFKFTSNDTRDEWVRRAGGRTRVAVKAAHVRDLFLGMSISDYREMLESMLPVDEDGLYI